MPGQAASHEKTNAMDAPDVLTLLHTALIRNPLGESGTYRPRTAVKAFYFGTSEGTEVLATVTALKVGRKHLDRERTVIAAAATGSAFIITAEIEPPITDPEELRQLAHKYAKAAIASRVIIDDSGLPPELPVSDTQVSYD